MARPRRKESVIYIRNDGKVFLPIEILEKLEDSAWVRGFFSPTYLSWDVKGDIIQLWVTSPNKYSVKLNVSGPRRTIQFRSRMLARMVGEGYKTVEII